MLICHNLQIIVINAVTVLNLKGVLPVDLTCKGKTSVKRNTVLLLMLILVFNFNYLPV